MLLCPRKPGRAPGVVTSALALIAPVAVLGAGCAQILGIEDLPEIRDGGNDDPDAGASDAGLEPPDAGPGCDGPALQAALRIDGTLATDGQQDPVVEVLLGDVVEISATSSCGGEGTLSYQWSIMPGGITGTADEDLASGPAAFTVYPTAAGDYTVTLTVRDAGGASADTTALAIRAHAWQVATVPPAMGEVRDLSVGGGNLWLATEGGPFLLPLAGPPDAFALVEVNGSSVPNDLQAVLFDDGTSLLWFGRSADEDGAWRLDTTVNPPESVKITWSASYAIGETAQTRDIAEFPGTLVVATSKGITLLDSSGTFFGRIQPEGQNPGALATGNGRSLAGSRQIYDLVSSEQFDSGAGGSDNRIRAMAIDTPNEDLWVGTDLNGVASFDLRENAPIAVYTKGDGSGLGSNDIRALVVEAGGPYAGDVWAATDAGVSRYIRQRDTWIHMGDAHGLTGHLDILSLAIDTDQNRRVIHAGSTAGVVYIRKP